jgi:hypothetical protein
MTRSAAFLATCAAGIVAAGVTLLAGQSVLLNPLRRAGDSVTGTFEGWYYNADSSRAFLVGYYNRNVQQELDIPVGPANRIEPGGPDLGQPTHFLPGRQSGMFSVAVPRDFKPADSYTWTITANGQTTSIPLRLHPDYLIGPFSEIAAGNTPPVIAFNPDGKTLQGPVASMRAAPLRSADLRDPLVLSIWTSDDMKHTSGTNAPITGARTPVTLRWSKYRGPGRVMFDTPGPPVEAADKSGGTFRGRATATATFTAPGEYVLHVVANDYSRDAVQGLGCCWTTGLLMVSVKP